MSTQSTIEIIASICPTKETDPRLDSLIDLSTSFVSSKAFGDKFNFAQALVVCHFFQLEAQSGGSSTQSSDGSVGGVTSIKEGQLQKTFGGPSTNLRGNQTYWGQTTSGQMLLTMFDACIFGPRNRTV